MGPGRGSVCGVVGFGKGTMKTYQRVIVGAFAWMLAYMATRLMWLVTPDGDMLGAILNAFLPTLVIAAALLYGKD